MTDFHGDSKLLRNDLSKMLLLRPILALTTQIFLCVAILSAAADTKVLYVPTDDVLFRITLQHNNITAPPDGSYIESRIGCWGEIAISTNNNVIVNALNPFTITIVQNGVKVKKTPSASYTVGPQQTLGRLNYRLLEKNDRFVQQLDLYIVNEGNSIYIVDRDITGGEMKYGPIQEGSATIVFGYFGDPVKSYHVSEGNKLLIENISIGSVPINIGKEHIPPFNVHPYPAAPSGEAASPSSTSIIKPST